jgi:hypothetical protein
LRNSSNPTPRFFKNSRTIPCAFSSIVSSSASLVWIAALPCYEAGLVNDKKASHRRPRAFFKARGVRYLFPSNAPAASGAGSGGANPRLVCSACELGGVGVTIGLGDVLRQNSQDLSPAAQPAIQGGGVPPSF